MKKGWSRAKWIGASLGFALLHFASFTVSYVRSEVIRPASDQPGWQTASEVLSFPLVYMASLPSPLDIFPVAIAANSLLWGTACTALVVAFSRRMARRSS